MEFQVGERTIKVEEPTGEDLDAYLDAVDSFQKNKESETQAAKEFLNFRDGMLAKLSGLSVKEVKKLPLISKNKMLAEMESRFITSSNTPLGEQSKK